MEKQPDCTALAARFDEMVADGLRDVKFFVRNPDEATPESVCKEVNSIYVAVERGEETPLDFKDSTHP